jgi:hypothetical protein
MSKLYFIGPKAPTRSETNLCHIAALNTKLSEGLDDEMLVAWVAYIDYKVKCLVSNKKNRCANNFGDFLRKKSWFARRHIYEICPGSETAPKLLKGKNLLDLAQELGYNIRE